MGSPSMSVVPTATPDIQESKVVLGTVYGHHQYIATSQDYFRCLRLSLTWDNHFQVQVIPSVPGQPSGDGYRGIRSQRGTSWNVVQVVYVEERINLQSQHIVRHITCTVKITVMSTNSITQIFMVFILGKVWSYNISLRVITLSFLLLSQFGSEMKRRRVWEPKVYKDESTKWWGQKNIPSHC